MFSADSAIGMLRCMAISRRPSSLSAFQRAAICSLMLAIMRSIAVQGLKFVAGLHYDIRAIHQVLKRHTAHGHAEVLHARNELRYCAIQLLRRQSESF